MFERVLECVRVGEYLRTVLRAVLFFLVLLNDKKGALFWSN